jgi:hypothetical protein
MLARQVHWTTHAQFTIESIGLGDLFQLPQHFEGNLGTTGRVDVE